MTTSKTPRPARRGVWLVSEGYGSHRRWTWHKYVETRLCILPGDGEAYEHIFACDETGHERRYGTAFITAPTGEAN